MGVARSTHHGGGWRSHTAAASEFPGLADPAATGGDLLVFRQWPFSTIPPRPWRWAELDMIGLDAESTLLVMTARSLVIDLIKGAIRNPAAVAEAEAIVRAVDPASPRPNQIDAYAKAIVVLRPALS